MAKKTFTIEIDDDYVAPEGPIGDNEAYAAFVMNMAVQSWKSQYGATSQAAAIQAAREARNADLPQPEA